MVHYILCRLLNDSDVLGVGKDQLESVLTSLRRDYPRELVPVVLAPLLYPVSSIESTSLKMAHEGNNFKKNMVENSLADLILETGYSFTSAPEECRAHMNAFGLREFSSASVARAIHYMARTHTAIDEQTLRNLRAGISSWPEQELAGPKTDDGQPQTWNMEIFVQVRALAA